MFLYVIVKVNSRLDYLVLNYKDLTAIENVYIGSN